MRQPEYSVSGKGTYGTLGKTRPHRAKDNYIMSRVICTQLFGLFQGNMFAVSVNLYNCSPTSLGLNFVQLLESTKRFL